MTGAVSALLAVQIALVVGVVATVAQIWVTFETWKDLRAVKHSQVNGDLLRMARWSAFISPLLVGQFAYMASLALLGVLAGPPATVSTFGLFFRWSYTVIMLIMLTRSVGDLLVRRGLSNKSFLTEDAALRERIVTLETRVEELTGEVTKRPTREELLADNLLLTELVTRLSNQLGQKGLG